MRLFQSILLSSIVSVALAAEILSSTGFINCYSNAQIQVNYASIKFVGDSGTGTVYFNISGTNTNSQDVSAELIVTALGQQVYSLTFDFCNQLTAPLCPVPSGTFAANGSRQISSNYLNKIPSIAFTIPDLDVQAILKLSGNGNELGCIEAGFTNGKTVNMPAITYAAGGIALAALAVSGFASLGSSLGSPAPAVTFSMVIGWFQTISQNGMLSVNYPPVYRAFTKNFAFSSGLIPWKQMQVAIDNFRASTGGNLQDDNLENATSLSNVRRGLENLSIRDIITSTSGDTSSSNNYINYVKYGIQGYVKLQQIPEGNAFMTVLITFAIVLAAITVAILLFKAILEALALAPSKLFPKRLVSFRKRYWMILAKTITSLIWVLYGTWTMWCIFQFTTGDSWAIKVLAAISLALFTAILAFFAIKIMVIGRREDSSLYQHKETWLRYSLFYNSYKQSCWWVFIPFIFYTFIKNCVLAGTNDQTPEPNQGFTQTLILLIIESLMLIFLIWKRPFATKATQVITIFIQVVTVLSLVCILLFVEKLGISRTAQTVAGIVLIAIQSSLSAILAILMTVGALIQMFRENPHRKKRKEAEKHAFDNLTALEARNSVVVVEPLDLKTIGSNAYTPISEPGKAAISTNQQLAPRVSIMEV